MCPHEKNARRGGPACPPVKTMNSEEQLLKNRIADLAQQAFSRGIYTFSNFLSPMEQEIYHSVKNSLPVSSHLFGGSGISIRKLIIFGSKEELGYECEPPLTILHVKPKNERFAEECTHRDYLGALMSLGIERHVTGDIIVRGKEAWIFALDTAADFISESLTSVRHNEVVCNDAGGNVPELSERFETIEANLASERMDLVIGAAAGVKREAAKKLLESERVFVNERLVSSSGHKLKSGDVIVIRGFGKYIYDGQRNTTKKGRINVLIRKYV